MESLVQFAFRLALALAAAGMLVPATKFMAREAAKSCQHGLISLTDLNRALMGGDIAKPGNAKHKSGYRP
jgi:hypothetical protein